MNLTALAATPSVNKTSHNHAPPQKPETTTTTTLKHSVSSKNQSLHHQNSSSKKTRGKNDKNSRKSARLVVKTKVNYAKQIDE